MNPKLLKILIIVKFEYKRGAFMELNRVLDKLGLIN